MNRLKKIAINAINLNRINILVEVYKNKELQNFIIELNRTDQLFIKGEQADGKALTSKNPSVGVYSKTTEILNRGKSWSVGGITKQKLAGDRYFLINEGKFYKSFKIRVFTDGSFKIDADTDKPDVNLIEEYGDILGLTTTNTNELIQAMLPIFIQEVRKELLR